MEFLNKLRKFTSVRFAAEMIAVSLLISVISVIGIVSPKAPVETVTGTVTDIIEEYDSIEQTTTYRVLITYTAAGKTYENAEYGSYHTGMKVGDTVEVEYSIEDPAVINAPGSDNIPYITLAVGLIVLVAGIVMLKNSLSKKSKDYNEYDRVDMSEADPAEVERIRSSTEPTNRYFFRFTGKMNQSYQLEDENHRVVYEAKLLKFSLVKNCEYEFINHVSGESRNMEIGHTVSVSTGSASGFSFRVPISSSFKVDGVSNWDYLSGLGFGFDFSMNGIKPCFRVKHYGVETAYIETSGADLFSEKETKNPLYKLPVNGYFHVECRDSELDGVFMTCLSITRAIFYEND